ncbi:hypothetical protein [Xanthomonas oryzae]|uniref:hypothetical protein n=1 Tax=Xanthomonas oryzae TaxID=347 RepID=UPI001A9EEFF0|nr:hypothetical protein [Xanthomonas oryzae]
MENLDAIIVIVNVDKDLKHVGDLKPRPIQASHLSAESAVGRAESNHYKSGVDKNRGEGGGLAIRRHRGAAPSASDVDILYEKCFHGRVSICRINGDGMVLRAGRRGDSGCQCEHGTACGFSEVTSVRIYGHLNFISVGGVWPVAGRGILRVVH